MALSLIIGSKRYSSWSLRPWIALKVAKIPFKEILVPLRQTTTAKALARHSPSRKVPVLIADKLKVWESLAILEYLADRYPAKGLWPTNREARALARAISSEMHAGFSPLRNNMPMDMGKHYPGEGHGPGVEADIARIDAIWQDCRKRFGKGGPFLFGKFTIADAMYAPVVSRFTTYGVKLSSASQTYCDAINALPAIAEWTKAAMREPEAKE